MTRALISLILICLAQTSARADEKPTTYHIAMTAIQFNPNDNTYTFDVRFIANPCPDVNYNISLGANTGVNGVKNSDEALAKVQPQIDKIAADLAKDEEKHCHTH
jgi:hypothetical protein